MTDTPKYYNKFHKFQFKTDSQKDMKLNNLPISNNIETMKIDDDFSNTLGIDYRNSGEGKDVDIEK